MGDGKSRIAWRTRQDGGRRQRHALPPNLLQALRNRENRVTLEIDGAVQVDGRAHGLNFALHPWIHEDHGNAEACNRTSHAVGPQVNASAGCIPRLAISMTMSSGS